MSLPPPFPLVLAQDPAAQSISILRWLGVIVVLVVVLIGVALWLRRRLTAEDEEVMPDSPGFTLADLRDLHKAGKLTDAEFATAKASMIARSRALLHPEEVSEGPFPTDVTSTAQAEPLTGPPPGPMPEKDDDDDALDMSDDSDNR